MGSGDREQDKVNRFQDAFERGRKGDVGSFEIWLREHKFRPDRVHRQRITGYFEENPELAPNHQDALETIAEYLGYVDVNREVHHIAVIGATGIGKTQLFHTTKSLLAEVHPDMECRIIRGEELGEKVENGFRLDSYIDEIKGQDLVVICIDDSYRDKRIGHSIESFEQNINSGVIFTSWTPEEYSFSREEITESVSPTNEIHLGPFSRGQSHETVQRVYDFIAEKDRAIAIDVKHQIHDLSNGVPAIIISLILVSLREAFLKDISPSTMEAIGEAAEQFQLVDAMKRIFDLSDQKMEILRWILLARHPKGQSPGNLVDKLNRDKSTISYHLRTLSDEGFVHSESDGRRSYYRVSNELTPLVQLRLAEEHPFHAEL